MGAFCDTRYACKTCGELCKEKEPHTAGGFGDYCCNGENGWDELYFCEVCFKDYEIRQAAEECHLEQGQAA